MYRKLSKINIGNVLPNMCRESGFNVWPISAWRGYIVGIFKAAISLASLSAKVRCRIRMKHHNHLLSQCGKQRMSVSLLERLCV